MLFLYFKSWFTLSSHPKTKKKAVSLLLTMFQICKPYPLHHLHIHLGICLLMQNCSEVQLPSFCHRLAICYQPSSLQQMGYPASREESVARRHFCLSVFISTLNHLRKLHLYSCNNPVHPNRDKIKYLVNASLIGNLQKRAMQLPLTLCRAGHPKSCVQYCVSQKHVLPTCSSSRLRGP